MTDAKKTRTVSGNQKRRLGRGLASLISNSAQTSAIETPPAHKPIEIPTDPDGDPQSPQEDPGTREIPVDRIAPNPYQPRRDFDNEQLAELTASVLEHGILQPLLVAPPSGGASDSPYILIAGERRLRAAKLAALTSVPCVLREADSRQLLEWAIIENVQRSDLNPIDRAKAYRDYIDRFSLTQAQGAQRLGQPRATIANYLRLLDLSDDVQQLLLTGRLSFGHAKVLAGLAGRPALQLALAGKTAARNLSVRQLEALVATANTARADATSTRCSRTKPPYILDLEQQLTRSVGTRVTIRTGRAKDTGSITIEFYGLDDFDRITGALGAKVES
ncbi:MAG: ParB/RepB/Spo0J family partition protein [Phycisphaerae bacterium]|nr:ParB/RepB/Spo0J family partition protein [Planctomycetota bacterium]MBL7221446.1 ParB/RepB/Spo0J family partition protein [Phycisphaerae bacterium]